MFVGLGVIVRISIGKSSIVLQYHQKIRFLGTKNTIL